jgi:predicted SnoaL-like aldol condensation-catalyzing enzyme
MEKSSKLDTKQKGITHENIISEYLKLVEAGKFEESLHFFTPNCITHNPYVKGNMKAIANAQKSAGKGMPTQDVEFSVIHLLSGGDIVAAHTELLFNKSKPSEGGLRQVHLFRFEGDKIVEYWDITQMIMKDNPNAAGAFTTEI